MGSRGEGEKLIAKSTRYCATTYKGQRRSQIYEDGRARA